jgi:hypothetical protein
MTPAQEMMNHHKKATAKEDLTQMSVGAFKKG